MRRSGSLGQDIGSPPPSPRYGVKSAGLAPRRGNWANLPPPACPRLDSLLQTGEGGSCRCAARCTKLSPHPAALLARSWALGSSRWPGRQPASLPGRADSSAETLTSELLEAAAASPPCACVGRAACRNCSPSLGVAGGAERGGAERGAYISQGAAPADTSVRLPPRPGDPTPSCR
ncbi:unnamed protein product [Rangifer tarandus platyrhynchus]|uniref:Uncharacterized protein n=1 Tax=Rangifer tarandus platyrhynchus TaxID=3082113 RepID=A0ABN8ZFQ0_RANTA|nr:unnamed protein product [Rangifer tarandus platyrhynchus]